MAALLGSYLKKPFAQRHGVGLVLAECQDSLQVRIDTQRFEQVMTNLLSNAVKFSPKSADVTIHASLEGSCVRIRVTDQGSGIPIEFQPRVFEKFAQASAGNTREQGGSGLGLAICKEITERMGGSIEFTSSAKGTEFSVLLPNIN
ncbi:histidine kinase/DNA gyrase B/HSP90-like ATPase [Aliidiomarina maris]|uniref:histidine kinase n=1 Tax=Aliidiomarina maris TaxID=531312 RepID=A0A327WZZ6_9GAMM|nr:histidine kinase/DNA gyrase B/HSP90-like ATPase [Aliidiomarina maris]